MTIQDWRSGYNTIEDFRKEFIEKSDDELAAIADAWNGQKPSTAAKLVLEDRRQSRQQAAELKRWWQRPLGLIAINIFTNLITAAIFYLLGRHS